MKLWGWLSSPHFTFFEQAKAFWLNRARCVNPPVQPFSPGISAQEAYEATGVWIPKHYTDRCPQCHANPNPRCPVCASNGLGNDVESGDRS